ncbi:hypothetical protein L596_019196 [Steinernema carpocapsae]|uniref:Uncharacterized protein n=1 Tax=Steinernema carpocapsae TaxID=34508 RepID=A0A4U5MPT8_STECR|nr:hypothetical protein L596_019196 [Steinernema carpocapsae]
MNHFQILLSRKRYRDLECFRIVALIGIVQLFCAPGTFLCGLTHLLDFDPWTEPPLNFVLALGVPVFISFSYSADMLFFPRVVYFPET